MSHMTITKIRAEDSSAGPMGQKPLASGVQMSMRLWENELPGEPKQATVRDYETVGYVIDGRAELDIEGETVFLEPGDSWFVPKGVRHTYRILAPFTAVEATCPPATTYDAESTPRPHKHITPGGMGHLA
jgi:quercetin dioxygenase-like cupin family protein